MQSRNYDLPMTCLHPSSCIHDCVTRLLVCVACAGIACFWGLQTMFKDRRDESWLGRGSIIYCATNPNTNAVECVHAFKVYVASMHFAVMTITSIGCASARLDPPDPLDRVPSALLPSSLLFAFACLLALT